MKKFTILLVLLCASLSVGSAQVQKRVTISSNPNEKMNQSVYSINSTSSAVLSASIPLVNSLNNQINHQPPILPSYLTVAALQRVYDFSPEDTSDTAFIMTSILNPQNKALTGTYDLPVRTIDLGAPNILEISGFAQFFKPFASTGGPLTIDTVAFDLFTFLKHADGTDFPRVKSSVLLFCYKTTKNLTSTAGGQVAISLGNIEQVGTEMEISADVINSRLVDANQPRERVIVPIDNPWVIQPNEMFGFGIYPTSKKDTMRLLGTHDWQQKDAKQCLGYYIYNLQGKTDEGIYKQSSLIYPKSSNPTLAAEFPSLVDVPIRVNYNFAVTGLTETSSVETLSDDAKAFALEPVTPNPVVSSTKIQFSLQQPAQVSLRVTNSLGQVVKELASGAMNTGTYSADFDANDLPTGMYYYTLVAGTQSLTRSMVVVK